MQIVYELLFSGQPIIITDLSSDSTTVKVGSSLSIQVAFCSNPFPYKLDWFHNGNYMKNTSGYENVIYDTNELVRTKHLQLFYSRM